MKKIFFLLFFFFFLIFTISSFPIQAEEENIPPQRHVCLSFCSEYANHSPCPQAEMMELRNTTPGGLNHHRVILKGENLAINKDIYILGCIPTTEGTIQCTTGNDETDRKIGAIPYSQLHNPPNSYTFAVQGLNPVQTGDGKLKVFAASYTPKGTQHRFFAVIPMETEIVRGRGSTLQYETFVSEEEIEKCAYVTWDPKGRVFDSQSLEPLPNVTVFILDESGNKVLTPNNPRITGLDGQFNFFVVPGTYILAPTPPPNYRFVSNPNLDPGYTKAYFNIYKPNEKIVEEAGKIEHRDIPLEPKGTPYRATAVLLEAGGEVSLGGQTEYSGHVSHPLSLVQIVTESTEKKIAETSADKFGNWKIILKNEEIPQDEKLIPRITKVDLTKPTPTTEAKGIIRFFLSKLFKKIFAQTLQKAPKKISFSPILRYLEGYAYDESGNVIPNAIVKVKMKMSDATYYQTTTDKKGFFTIPPERLPIFEYYLEFQSPLQTKTIHQTTAEFVQKNKNYLFSNEINLMTATKKNQPIIEGSQKISPTQSSTISRVSPQTQETTKIQPSPSIKTSKVNVLLVITLFILITFTGVGLIVFIFRSKKTNIF